ncbi:MAG: hypothetical protein JW892_02840 [Anaerolineae bacterium]|nr:hypothetical protein [Anaerolineae bacterium]
MPLKREQGIRLGLTAQSNLTVALPEAQKPAELLRMPILGTRFARPQNTLYQAKPDAKTSGWS